MSTNRLTNTDKDYMAACLRFEIKSCGELLKMVEGSDCEAQDVSDALRRAGDNMTRIREGLDADMLRKRWPHRFYF